jgi:hypothetical protein
MEGSGPPSADPEVSLADAALAAEIARAAAQGRGADRAPTLEQLLSAFGEAEPTDQARRRVQAALRLAGVAIRPDLLDAPPGERVMLLPPGTSGRSTGRAVGGVLALGLILIVAIAAAALLSRSDETVDDGLPETTSFAVSTGTQPATTSVAAVPTTTGTATAKDTTATTKTAATAATTPTPAETTPTATTPTKAEQAAARHRRDRRVARKRRAREAAAAAKRIVVVRVDATEHPTFLCADDAHGRQLFGGTLSGRKTF